MSTAILALSTELFASCGLFGHTFSIPSCANYPTLKPGNRINVKEPPGSIQRGDVVVFHPPTSAAGGRALPTDVMMRVVGMPGDQIASVNGAVTINGRVLQEAYLAPGTVTMNLSSQRVPIREYFVMGDNRSDSLDSRYYGPIAAKAIIARMTGFASKHVDSSTAATCTV